MDKQCGAPGCKRPGTTGGDCFKHKFESGVRINGVHLFRHDREHGTTQMAKAREIFEDSRRDGKQIAQVRGRRGPHEVLNAGRWQKV